jgi:hypothetical protein
MKVSNYLTQQSRKITDKTVSAYYIDNKMGEEGALKERVKSPRVGHVALKKRPRIGHITVRK